MATKVKSAVDDEMIAAINQFPDMAKLDGLMPAMIAHRLTKMLRDMSAELILPEERVRDTVDFALSEVYKNDNPLSLSYVLNTQEWRS